MALEFLSGAGAGASQALEELIKRQYMQALQQQQMEQAQQRIDLDRAGLNQRSIEHADLLRAQETDRLFKEKQERNDSNRFGLEQMHRDKQTMDADADKAALDAEIAQLPEGAGRRVVRIRRFGGPVIQPETAETSDERSTREAGDLKRITAIADAQAGAAAKYRAPERERMVQVGGPNGVPIWVPESQAAGRPAAQAPRAVTGSERQTLSFYNRAKQASDDIGGMEEDMAKAGMGAQLQQQYAPNMFQSETQQRYRQAQRAFTEARLRKESGAAIPTGEYENDARTYFAQPGDSPQVIEQKRKARQVVLDGLKFSAGKAFNEFYGDDGPQQPAQGGGAVEYVRDPKTGKLVRK